MAENASVASTAAVAAKHSIAVVGMVRKDAFFKESDALLRALAKASHAAFLADISEEHVRDIVSSAKVAAQRHKNDVNRRRNAFMCVLNEMLDDKTAAATHEALTAAKHEHERRQTGTERQVETSRSERQMHRSRSRSENTRKRSAHRSERRRSVRIGSSNDAEDIHHRAPLSRQPPSKQSSSQHAAGNDRRAFHRDAVKAHVKERRH